MQEQLETDEEDRRNLDRDEQRQPHWIQVHLLRRVQGEQKDDRVSGRHERVKREGGEVSLARTPSCG
jgi:hypothetical protein